MSNFLKTQIQRAAPKAPLFVFFSPLPRGEWLKAEGVCNPDTEITDPSVLWSTEVHLPLVRGGKNAFVSVFSYKLLTTHYRLPMVYYCICNKKNDFFSTQF